MDGRVTVIGGGISGLALAYWLTREGLDVTLLEKENREGGCIRSESQDGYLIDHAANCLLNFLPEVDDLCDGVGVSSQKIFRSHEAKFRYLLKDGRLVPVPTGVGQFAGTNLWSLKGKMRLLSEPFIRPARGPAHGKNGENGKEESVAHFIKRRMGEEFLEYAIEPFVSGNYAGDVERLGIQSTFPRLFDLERRYGSLTLGAVIQRLRGSKTNCQRRLFSFQDGMAALPGAISRFLGHRLLKGHQVIGLEPRNKGWEVTAIGPSKEIRRFSSDAVALSAPAESAANLTAALSGTLKGLLAAIEYSPVVVLYLGFARNQVR
ncbi:MAG: protoporphyrinogen oxidase, partial [Nitrospirae bacterium]|nr:protoporphyrinogen oxidase [Nitrospirota bacterium]